MTDKVWVTNIIWMTVCLNLSCLSVCLLKMTSFLLLLLLLHPHYGIDSLLHHWVQIHSLSELQRRRRRDAALPIQVSDVVKQCLLSFSSFSFSFSSFSCWHNNLFIFVNTKQQFTCPSSAEIIIEYYNDKSKNETTYCQRRESHHFHSHL